MINVVGIGNAGCAVADSLSSYPQYKIYKVDTGLPKKKGNFSISKKDTPEEYEASFPARTLSSLKKITGDTMVVVGLGGNISSCVLRVLEALSHNDCEVVAVHPAESFLTTQGKALNKMVFMVLQEYARSGLIKRLYMVSNENIEKVVGEMSVSNYFGQINQVISSTIHMINVYKNSEPCLSNIKEPSEVSRISTIGLGDMKKISDKMFFPLDYVGEKTYYFAIGQEQLDNDKTLLEKIKNRTEQEDTSVSVSFGVYPTSYEENYVYVVSSTKIIQGADYGTETL